MALSGAIEKVFGTYFKFRIEWSATQNITNNTSTVTANMYLISTSSGAYISSSATKNANISIDGKLYAFSAAGLANLTGNQKKLIKTHSQVVNHNADGTKTFALSGVVGVNVTLSGSYVGDVSVSQNFTLDTIARASSISSGASWVAGENITVNINRASSSFTHTVVFYVNDVEIKRIGNVGTSTSSSFSVAENEKIFAQLARGDSKKSWIDLYTYSGSTQIGLNGVGGTCSNSAANTASMPSFSVGANPTINITKSKSYFGTRLTLTLGSFSKSKTDASTNPNFGFTTTDNDNMLGQMTTVMSKAATLKVETLYGNTLVRDAKTYNVTVSVPSYDISFGGGFSYEDSNQTTVNITGNNQYIIQNMSNVYVTLPDTSKASSAYKGTITKYEFLLNGITKSLNYSSGTLNADFGKINTTSNLTLTVTAFDTRGKTKAQQLTVVVLPYGAPLLSANIKRKNNYEEEAYLNASGTYYPLNVEGVQKNVITNISYRYKAKDSSTWGVWTNWATMTLSLAVTDTFTLPEKTFTDLDSLKEYNFEVKISDTLGSVTTSSLLLSAGEPLLYMDSLNKKVGIRQITTDNNAAMEVNGGILPLYNYNGTTAFNQTPLGLSILYSNDEALGLPSTYTTALTVGANVNRQFQIAAKNDGTGLWYRVAHSNNTGGTGQGWTAWKSILGTSISDPLTISGNGKSIRIGTGSADTFINNTKSNKYLQLKDDGTLSYSDDNVLLRSMVAQGATASKIVERDSSGDITCRLVRSNYQNESRLTGGIVFRVNTSDNYLRVCSDAGAARGWLGAFASSGGTLSGNITFSNSNSMITGKQPHWVSSTFSNQGILLGDGGYLRPTAGNSANINTQRYALGHGDYRYTICYLTHGVNNTSDIRTKTDVEYLDNPISKASSDSITSLDFYNFFKEDYKPIIYKHKEVKDGEDTGIVVGFSAQDLISYKIGKTILNDSSVDKYSSDEANLLSYDMGSWIGAQAVALKEAIKTIERLKDENRELREDISAIENVLISAGLAH